MQIPNVFQTNDTALATTLHVCGATPSTREEDGKPFPQLMIYDRAKLVALGYKGDAEQAAKQAMREKKAGIRIYNFERTPKLERIIRAYREAERLHDAGQEIPLEEQDYEDVAKFALMFTRMRNTLLSDFHTPAILAMNEDVVVKLDEKDSCAKVVKRETGQVIGTMSGRFAAIGVKP